MLSSLHRLIAPAMNAPAPRANATLSDTERSARIRAVVTAACADLRQRHPILNKQDAIGASILAFALGGMLLTTALYAMGTIAWWVCIPVNAVLASLTHELEHDLIHLMYFRRQPGAHRLMMWLVWLARPSTISPFTRRRMHLHHHKASGTDSDLEEQGITNGEGWGLRRLLMTADSMLSIYLRPRRIRRIVRDYIRAQNPQTRDEVKALIREQTRGYFPLGTLYYLAWHSFIAYHAVSLAGVWLGHPVAWPLWIESAMPALNVIAVAWLAPNALRTFCLHFVSSNMHYFGDIEDQNIMQQCQVWNAWWLAPLHLFCFNFGSTHAIHHFVVKEPFYIRQLTAKQAHAVMRDMGVRFNDFGTFGRANRFGTLRGSASA